MASALSPGEQFYRDALARIGREAVQVVDIGGGLRISRERGNRYDPAVAAWAAPLLAGCEYLILDPVPTYRPNLVGDLKALPFRDGSCDAILCIAVLEHVDDPFTACAEMCRALRPGGLCLLFAPFCYNEHREPGYYDDYFRFTPSGLRRVLRGFRQVDVVASAGRAETLAALSPLGRYRRSRALGRALDGLVGRFKPDRHKVTLGYFALAVK